MSLVFPPLFPVSWYSCFCSFQGSTLVGGTVADLFEAANRGLPMSIFSICAFAGTGLGPAVSGYIELKKGWRWIEWVQVRFSSLIPA